MVSLNNNSVSEKNGKKEGDIISSSPKPIIKKPIFTVERLGEIFDIVYEIFTKISAVFLIMFNEFISLVRELGKVDPRKMKSLEGKVVLITGANSGIGESLAKHFYLAGCKLILAARRTKELERARDELLKLEGEEGKELHSPVVLQLDLSDIPSIPKKTEEALEAFGDIDILVNNAGIFNQGRTLDTVIDVDQRVMTVNYLGPLALTKQIATRMVQQKKGQIVFVSSVLGKMTITNSLSYSASKHAIQALADGLRAELSSDGITVTIASPSYVKTDISVNALTSAGTQYGVVTNEIEKGYSPDYVSERIFKAVVNKEADVVIAPIIHRGAIYLRSFLPYMYFVGIRLYGHT